jgi:hypothetical protein
VTISLGSAWPVWSRLIIDLLLGWFFPKGVFQDKIYVSKCMVACVLFYSPKYFIKLI